MAKYRIFDKDKFAIVGNPIVTDDGIASGFSGSNYIKTGIVIGNKPFKIITKCLTSQSGNGILLDFASGSGWTPLLLQNNNIITSWAKDTTNNSILNKNIVIPYNTYCIVSLEFTGLKYILGLSSDNGKTWTYEENTNANYIKNIDKEIIIGRYGDFAQGGWQGSIDLSQFSITVDGVEVFSGSHEITINEQMLELIETKNRIKNAIINKGIKVTSDTPFREYADKIGNIESFNLNPLIFDGIINFCKLNRDDKTITCGSQPNTPTNDTDPGIKFDIKSLPLNGINPIHIKLKYIYPKFISRSQLICFHNDNYNDFRIITYGNTDNSIALITTTQSSYDTLDYANSRDTINEIEAYIYPDNSIDITINGVNYHNFKTSGISYSNITVIEFAGSGASYNNGLDLYYEDSFIEINGVKHNIFIK